MIDFLTNCGNKNLQYLLVPSRLEAALAQLDSDRDGEIDCNEWEDAIETALRNKLAQRAKAREAQAKAAAKEIAKFTSEFLNAARQCFTASARGARHSFQLASRRRRGSCAVRRMKSPTARLPRRIDKDNSGTLEKPEIVRAVKEDKKVIDFLKNCGEENLQFLLHPPRLDKALDALDTDKSGELDIEECTARRLFVSARFALLTVVCHTGEAAINRGLAKRLEQLADERERRQRAAERADAEFTLEFLNAAREVFQMIDKDDSNAR